MATKAVKSAKSAKSKKTATEIVESEKKPVVKAALPQILSVLSDQEEDADAIVLLLEEGADIREKLGRAKPTQTEPASGLLGRMEEIKEELGQRQSLLDLDGIRHNNIAFVMTHKDGRSTFSQDKAKKALMSAGVDVKIIAKAFKAATGHGESYYERELAIIKEGKS